MVLEENFKSIIRIYEVMLIVYFRRKEEVEYLEYWNIGIFGTVRLIIRESQL